MEKFYEQKEIYKQYSNAILTFDYIADEKMKINDQKTFEIKHKSNYKNAFFYLYPETDIKNGIEMTFSALRKTKINIENVKPIHTLLYLFMYQYAQRCSRLTFSPTPKNMTLKILTASKQHVKNLYKHQIEQTGKEIAEKDIENYLQKITLFTSSKIIHLMFSNMKLIENVNFITQKDNFTNFIQDIINNVDIVDLKDFDNKGNLIKSTEIDNLYDTEINLAFSIIASGYFFEKDDEYNRFYQLAENYNIFCDVMKGKIINEII